jgi:hypothetical protein
MPQMWTLAFGHHEDRTPTHSYACVARGRDAGFREELAEGAPMTFETVVAECPQSRQTGKQLLVLSITGFDPQLTPTVLVAARWVVK